MAFGEPGSGSSQIMAGLVKVLGIIIGAIVIIALAKSYLGCGDSNNESAPETTEETSYVIPADGMGEYSAFPFGA